MARIIKNNKEFKVINLSRKDAASLGFGIYNSGTCICMDCNKECPNEDIYYIAVLNDTMCKECYKKWVESAKKYAEDISIENKNFNYYKNLLYL